MVKNALAAGDLPWTPLGDLTVLPRPPSWTKGRERKEKRGDGTREEGELEGTRGWVEKMYGRGKGGKGMETEKEGGQGRREDTRG